MTYRTASKGALTATLAATLLATAVQAARVPSPDPLQGDGRVSPFYTWKGEIPGRPGVLLRSEPLSRPLELPGAAWQIRFLFTSTDGVKGREPIVVSGALYVPKGARPAGGWPVVAWGHGTLGVADICAPSWAGRSYRDVRYLDAWLSQGFAVVASDYQGIGVPGPNPALNNRSNAYTILDSARAVIRSHKGLANKVLLVGQSQGGAAVFAAAGYAPVYAPDLHILGTVGTGVMYSPPRKPGAVSAGPAFADPHKVQPTIAYQYYSILSAQQVDPSIKATDVLTDLAAPLIEEARGSCLFSLEEDVVVLGLTPATAYRAGGRARLQPWWDAFQKFPTLKIRQPVFIGVGATDTLAPSDIALIHDACAAGTVVEGHVYAGHDHMATVNASLRDSIPFVRKLLAGQPITPSCHPVPQG